MAGYYERKFGKAGDYHVTIQYADGKTDEGRTSGRGSLRIRRDGLAADKVGRRDDEGQPDGIPDVRLTVDNVGKSPVKNIIVEDDVGNQWQLTAGRRVVVEGKAADAADLPGHARPWLAFRHAELPRQRLGDCTARRIPTRPKAAGRCSATRSCLRP